MGIFDGFAKLGLGSLEKSDIWEESQKNVKEAEKIVLKESDFLFDKMFECPICGKKSISKIVRASKAKMLGNDLDLRPNYDQIDPIKYDTVTCLHCGYSALQKYHGTLLPSQVKWVQEGVCNSVKLPVCNTDYYSYEYALERFRIALACAMVKKAKDSEKAYILLKMAWLTRGQTNEYCLKNKGSKLLDEYKARQKKIEMEYLQNAYQGFIKARQKESFPIANMEMDTLDYLLAVLAYEIGLLDDANKMIATILVSNTANNRIKDKARDLKELVKETKVLKESGS